MIVTLPDLQGYEIADYGYRLGREWGIGDSERDDGVLLIVAPNERQMRIEVGYGLEGILPDGLAFEYIEEMKDFFRDGQFSAGIALGAERILTQLQLPPEEATAIAQQATQERERTGEGGYPIGALIWLGFILFFFVLPMFGRRGKRRSHDAGKKPMFRRLSDELQARTSRKPGDGKDDSDSFKKKENGGDGSSDASVHGSSKTPADRALGSVEFTEDRESLNSSAPTLS